MELWSLNGADHIYLYKPVNDITEANDIWRFFTKCSRPSPAAASIGENEKNIELSVFPNPTYESVTVSVDANTEISIIDVNGKVCFTKELKMGESMIEVANGSAQRLVVE